MEKIKIKIENQFGEVDFETTQKKIDEFNEDYGWDFEELCEEDDFTIDVRTFGTDAYLFFESEGMFILIQEWELTDSSDSDISVYPCFSIVFENCTCPPELERSLQMKDGVLIYIKDENEIWFGYPHDNEFEIDNSRFQQIVENGESLIEREGVLRYKEWKSILELV